MNLEKKSTSIKKNIIISMSSQTVSLLVSLIINLVVPRFISELQYSHWQVFVLYISYVGILHFGLLDGLVLRYSQFDYEELDKPRIRSQFVIMSIALLCFALIGSIISLFWHGAGKTILIMVSVGMVTKNIFTYVSYTFQITNRINRYAQLVIIQRLSFCIITVTLLFLRVDHYVFFCAAELLSDLISILLTSKYNRGLYFGEIIELKEAFRELWLNVSSGALLLIANWASMLLVGSAKMLIQYKWDEITFGKVSFAFSITNLFLTFVTAISVVLFPSLKRREKNKLPDLYEKIRDGISPILFITLILYYPGCIILVYWLPKYQVSLVYLGILLPLIVFSSKVSLLTNNYLKAYRKERTMLFVNIIVIVISFALYCFSAYVLESLSAVLVSVVVAVMLRSIVSEILVSRLIHKNFTTDYLCEVFLTVVFICCARLLPPMLGFILYFIAIVLYCLFKRESILNIYK